jgi:subtilisin family serine protease
MLVLAGCRGGSGSGIPNITPGPKAACAVSGGKSGQSLTPTPCPTGSLAPSVYTIDSNPQGVAIQINNVPAGTTPTSFILSFAGGPVYSVTVSGATGSYTYTVQQNGDGPHTLYYNAAADTSGSLTSVSTSSAFTRPGARLLDVGTGPVVMHPARSAAGRTAVDPNHLAVFYHDSMLPNGSADAIESAAGIVDSNAVGPVQGDTLTHVVSIPAGKTADAITAALTASPAVIGVAPIQYRYLMSVTAKNPNDTHFGYQWDMQRIGAPYAWGYSVGSKSLAIAVIDTGYDQLNTDLANKVDYSEQVNGGKVTISGAVDLVGHGTNVSAIAAAISNNAFGFAGMGWNNPLMEFKVFFPDPSAANKYAEPQASTSDEAQAIYDAVGRGARVISLSLGSAPNQPFDPIERDAIAFALKSNVVVVAAAGNEGSGSLDYPAAYDGVISVGATSLNDGSPGGNGTPAYSSSFPDTIASFSNYGPQLSLVAPGGDPTTADLNATSLSTTDLNHWITNLYSTQVADPTQQCASKSDCFAVYAGTSQATPHVAGAAALMLSQNPALTPAQIKSILMSTADDIGDSRQGAGRLNAYRALAVAVGDTAPVLPSMTNFVAFAYMPSAGNSPQIINTTYTAGVRLKSDGSFRVPDIPAGASGYKIGVWYNANGTGVAGPGDYFASTAVCPSNASCGSLASGLTAHPITTGFQFN